MAKSDNEIKNKENIENLEENDNLDELDEIKELDDLVKNVGSDETEVEHTDETEPADEVVSVSDDANDDEVTEVPVIGEPEKVPDVVMLPVRLGREIVADDDNTFGMIGKKKKHDQADRATVTFEYQKKSTGLVDETSDAENVSYGLKPDETKVDDVSASNPDENKPDEQKLENKLTIIGKAKALKKAADEKRAAAALAKEEAKKEAQKKADEDALLAELFDEPNKNVLGDISEMGIDESVPEAEDEDNMPKKKPAAKNVKKTGKKPVNANKKAAKPANLQAKNGGKNNNKDSSNNKKTGAAVAAGAKKKTKSPKVKKKRNKVWAFFRAIIIFFVTLGIIGCLAGGGYAAYVISQAETIHPDRIYEALDVSSHIYDQDGNLVDEVYYSENRQIVQYEQLPENLKNAIVAVEDKTFWTHRGFNFKRIIGAVLEKFKGGRISGTSTLTQQLARNVFLPDEKGERTIKRKIIEMYYAHEIEQELSKEDIITAYLNTVYFGYGCYGVDTAARTYFGTTVENLTLEQCAALAAMPQSPDVYALLTSAEGDNTTKIREGLYANDTSQDRRNLVLKLMEEQGYITAEEREAATKPIADFINPGKDSITSKSAFKDYLIETVKNDLMTTYDLTDEQASKMIYTRGLKIYSTLAPKTQAIITKEFAKDSNFPKAQGGKEVQAAMVIVEVGTGQIKAMVGSRNASGEMLFNRATNARQPGSSIKPLTVYSAALQKSYELEKAGKTWKFQDFHYDKQGTLGWGSYITTSSIVADQRMKINDEEWPKNVTRSYSGIQTFRTALQKSINTCAVKILSQVGVDYSMQMLKNYGITTAIDDTSSATNDLNYAALGLGAMSVGVTPLEMACAYAAFPNGGVRNTPICYTKVEDSNGNVILEGKSETVKVMDEGVAWIMTDVLKSVVSRGIAGNARVSGVEVGGKTGTTDDRYDIWFDGFTPELSAALWIGTDENVRMDSASDVAARTWSTIMGQLKRSTAGSYKSMPSNVIKKNGEYYTEGTEHRYRSDDFGGVTDDNKYIPSIYDRINGWTRADQEKADKKLEEEAKKKAEEEAESEEDDD